MSSIYRQDKLPTADVVPNTGQIEGVPKNGRVIKGERFDALCKAIEQDPSTLSVYEIIVFPTADKYVAIGGNMRLRACKKLGIKEVLCKILNPDTPREKLIEIALKDNAQFSEIDLQIAQGAYSVDQLLDYGVEIPEAPEVEYPEPTPEAEPLEEPDEDDAEPKVVDERIIIVFPNGEKEKVEKLFGCKIEGAFIHLDDILKEREK